jgi:nitrogenase-stabilizing/protective protein
VPTTEPAPDAAAAPAAAADPEARVVDRLRRCTSAEEYFDLLGLPYDQRVLDVNRLHILRRFAQEIESLPPPLGGAAPATGRYREALTRAYQTFVTGTALDHRLFKVLRDHAPQAFVPSDQVRVHPARTSRTAAR